MKMETPLEVLSRAASIVQKEEQPSTIKSSGKPSHEDLETAEDARRGDQTPPLSPNANVLKDRRSPKRQHSTTERSLKKLKLEDKEENYGISTYHVHSSSGPITSTTYTYNKTPITVPIKRHSVRESSPPPLISIHETRKNRSTLPDYDSLFPRPSVISSSPPTGLYIDYCRKGCSCRDCNRSYLSESKYPHLLKKSNITKVITRDFDLPTVDDHFRKSLGDKYDFSKNFSNFDERPSSVDDHFAKALGTKWYSLEYGRCASS